MHNHSAGSQQLPVSLSMPWYTRRDGVVRGPFSTENISRYILLGRIRLSDELSNDRQGWKKVEQVSSVIPDVMARLGSWNEYQLYMNARLLADERVADRRCASCKNRGKCAQEKRQLADRRSPESLLPPGRGGEGHNRLNFRYYYKSGRLRYLLLTVMLASLLIAWLVPVSR